MRFVLAVCVNVCIFALSNLITNCMNVKKIPFCLLALLCFAGCQLSTDETGMTNQVELVNSSKVQTEISTLDSVAFKEACVLRDLNQNLLKTRGVILDDEGLSVEEKALVKSSLMSLTEATKPVLHECGLTDQDIIDIFGSVDDDRIALLGLVLVDAHRQAQPTRSIEWDDVVSCAGEVLGVNAFYELRGAFVAGKKIAKVAMKQMLKKVAFRVASRLAGPVGAGLAVAEFGWCLYRAD